MSDLVKNPCVLKSGRFLGGLFYDKKLSNEPFRHNRPNITPITTISMVQMGKAKYLEILVMGSSSFVCREFKPCTIR